MKQIKLLEPGRFESFDVPQPCAAPGEALVHICAVGVCGSDFHAFAGRHPAYTYPRVLGHELSGIVVDAPPNDKGIVAGDRCAVEPYISCGRCRACVAGRTNCCVNLKLFGVHVDGGMQSFLSVPVSLLHKSKILSLDQLALIETLGIGAHAVVRSNLIAGEQAIVVGGGPIGLAVAQFAQAAGALVHLIERSDWRRTFAQDMGFTVSAEPRAQVADAVFDATGNAESMSASLHFAAPTGRIVYVGLTRESVSIEDPLFHRQELTLFASRNSCGQFPRIIQMIEEKRIDTSRWITDRLALADVPTRFGDLPRKATLMKAIVDVAEADA